MSDISVIGLGVMGSDLAHRGVAAGLSDKALTAPVELLGKD